MTDIVDLSELARRTPSGCKLAIPSDQYGLPMAYGRALLKTAARDLHVVCVPIGGILADMLVGAGRVATLETSAVTLGEAGGAPRFSKAIRAGAIHMKDATCPAIHTGLMAAQKGAPFMPMRGLIGTDVLANRPDWPVIDNPFADGADPVVAIPAIHPDIAVFHAPAADRFGNILIGRRRELAVMAYAARRTFVTVERIVEDDLFETEISAASTLPSLYVDAVAVAPKGAAPCGLWGEYATDSAEIARYAEAARTDEGFRDYLGLAAATPEFA